MKILAFCSLAIIATTEQYDYNTVCLGKNTAHKQFCALNANLYTQQTGYPFEFECATGSTFRVIPQSSATLRTAYYNYTVNGIPNVYCQAESRLVLDGSDYKCKRNSEHICYPQISGIQPGDCYDQRQISQGSINDLKFQVKNPKDWPALQRATNC